MNWITFGQYLPKVSRVHSLDPRTKIFLVLVLMIFSLAADSAAGGILLALFTVLLIVASKVPLRWYLKGCQPLIGLIIIAALFQLFLTPGKIIAELGIIRITLPGIQMATLLAYRLAMIYLAAQLLTCTTSPMQLTDGLEHMFRPFKKIGFPVHETAMIMMIALRFIPVFFEESEKVMRAQLSRGADINTGTLARMGNMVAILVPLFTRALRRADELALAMEVRCYTGSEGRTRMYNIEMNPLDHLMIVLTAVIAALSVVI